MDTRLRQPGFSRGRGTAGALGRGNSRDSCASGGSLPPINDRSISKESRLPRTDSERARSIGASDALPQLGKKGSMCRDNSLPPILQPSIAIDVTEGRQSTSVRPPRPQAAQRSQSHTSTRNQEPAQQRSSEHGRNGSRASRPPKEPQHEEIEARAEDSPRTRRTPPAPRARSVSQKRISSPSARRRKNADRHAKNDEAFLASPRNERREIASGARPSSPPVPAISAQVSTGRPASPPIPTLVTTGQTLGMDGDDIAVADVLLVPCRHCGRKFRPEAKARHEAICVKVFQKERRKFKAVEQRAPSEALQLQQETKRAQRRDGNKLRPGQVVQNQASNNWRVKSEAFRNAIKESRVISRFQREGRDLRDLPPPKALPQELDDRVPCPHCGRRFGQQQAERHIPQCKNIKAKPNGILRAHAAAPKPKSRR